MRRGAPIVFLSFIEFCFSLQVLKNFMPFFRGENAVSCYAHFESSILDFFPGLHVVVTKRKGVLSGRKFKFLGRRSVFWEFIGRLLKQLVLQFLSSQTGLFLAECNS